MCVCVCLCTDLRDLGKGAPGGLPGNRGIFRRYLRADRLVQGLFRLSMQAIVRFHCNTVRAVAGGDRLFLQISRMAEDKHHRAVAGLTFAMSTAWKLDLDGHKYEDTDALRRAVLGSTALESLNRLSVEGGDSKNLRESIQRNRCFSAFAASRQATAARCIFFSSCVGRLCLTTTALPFPYQVACV